MPWFDNLIGAFWILLQILLWVGALAVVFAVVAAVILGIWQYITRSRSKEPARQTLLDAAEATAISQYRRERDPLLHVEAFTQGADYMWEHLHPKK